MARSVLTERQVRTAAPPAGKAETDLRDGERLVLRVRRGPDGRVTRQWLFEWRVATWRRRVGLGAYPRVGLRAARASAERLTEQLDAGIMPIGRRSSPLKTAAAPDARPFPRTLDDLATRWESDYLLSKRKDHGVHAMGPYRLHVAPRLGSVRLTELRKLHVVEVLAPLAAAGSGQLAARVLGTLRQLCRWGLRHDYLATDPTAALSKADYAGRVVSRDRVLSAEEIVDLRDRMGAVRIAGPKGRQRHYPILGLPTQAAVWVMIATLARVGELSRARWADVDLDAGLWQIPQENAKNGLPHVIHLSDFARRHFRHLRAYAAGSAFVLPDRTGDNHLDLKAVNKQLHDRQRPGAKAHRGRSAESTALLLPGGPFTAHDLRRTGATAMQALGVGREVIERCLNHVDGDRLVATYQRAQMLPERREAFERLGAWLDGLAPAETTGHLAL